MRKMLIFVLCLALLLPLFGCAGDLPDKDPRGELTDRLSSASLKDVDTLIVSQTHFLETETREVTDKKTIEAFCDAMQVVFFPANDQPEPLDGGSTQSVTFLKDGGEHCTVFVMDGGASLMRLSAPGMDGAWYAMAGVQELIINLWNEAETVESYSFSELLNFDEIPATDEIALTRSGCPGESEKRTITDEEQIRTLLSTLETGVFTPTEVALPNGGTSIGATLRAGDTVVCQLSAYESSGADQLGNVLWVRGVAYRFLGAGTLLTELWNAAQ